MLSWMFSSPDQRCSGGHSTDMLDPQTEKGPRPREWVKGVVICAGATALVTFVNIVLTVAATALAYSKFDDQGFTHATLYKGKCSLSKNWATGLHLLINALSTVVLAASNYCMQCLSSPSREDVDRAHAQRIPLDIGSPSFRNLWFVPARRRILWFVLLITSLPFHLMSVCTPKSSDMLIPF